MRRSEAPRRCPRIVRNGDHLRIDIGFPRPAVLGFAASAIFAVWIAIGSAAVANLLAPDTPDVGRAFMAMWAAGWFLEGGPVLGYLCWRFLAREVVSVGGGALQIRRGIGPLASRRVYGLARIVNLRAEEPRARSGAYFLWPPPLETIAFDHGTETVRFGRGLVASDVAIVLESLRARLPGAG